MEKGEPPPPGWDPLELDDQPLDPDDTLGPGGGTGFGQETPEGVSADPAPPSPPTGAEVDFVDRVLVLEDFPDGFGSADPHSGRVDTPSTDPNSSIPGSVQGPSTSVGDVPWAITDGPDSSEVLNDEEFVRSLLDLDSFPVDTPSFTDPNSSIPGSVQGPSTSVGDVPWAIIDGPESSGVLNDEEIEALLGSYFDSSSELHTSGVETPTQAIPGRELTVESVVEKLTRTTKDNKGNIKFVLTDNAHDKLLRDAGLDPERCGRNTVNYPTTLSGALRDLPRKDLRQLHSAARKRICSAVYQASEKGKKAHRERWSRNYYAQDNKPKDAGSAALGSKETGPRQFHPTDGVVDGGVGKSSRVVPVTALMGAIFAAVALIAAVLAELNGWGGSESEKKLRAGAAGLGDGGEHSGAATAQQGRWSGRAAEAYDTDSATLAGLSAVMADTDTTTAALLQAHDQQLETTRTVIDSTDALLTVSDPIAVALEALPATGPALSVAFQLSVAIPALHACYSAEQHALHSSARTAAALQDAAATYDYIHTTATQLTSLT